MRYAFGLLAALALTACSAAPATPSQNSSIAELTESNRAIVTAFARQFYEERDVRGAFETYVVPDYIQHNPGIPDGRDAAVAMLEPLFSQPGASFAVKRIMVDGEYAVIHLHGRPDPAIAGVAVADLYRLADGKIVEHWDVIQPIAADTVNPHPYF
jgi:predicted SnoaL-like aldol condensation-catalyzing enzyme